MIQPHNNPFVKLESARRLSPPRHVVAHNVLAREDKPRRLEDLADVAVWLQEPGLCSPTTTVPPSISQEPTHREYIPAASVARQCRLPSCSDLIAAVDRQPAYDGCYSEPNSDLMRRESSSSISSWQGSFYSVSGLSPCTSTAETSPVMAPATSLAYHNIPPHGQLSINVRVGSYLDDPRNMDEQQVRRLAAARPRRPSSRQIPYSPVHKHRQNSDSRRHSTTTIDDRKKKPHFNQKYGGPDRIFIRWHKDDCKMGWESIKQRRLTFLPVLLGSDYNREVEEQREVSGLNGQYYRENELCPALTPDGSGLLFMEKGGRCWEYTKSQKCREKGATKKHAALDTRPRGVVERYPEEVVYYWDQHVRPWIPEEKQAEVYTKAKRYCELRAEQRRQMGVPQWSLDNRDERVIDLTPPTSQSDGKGKSSKRKGRKGSDDNSLPDMMSACLLNPPVNQERAHHIPRWPSISSPLPPP